jgi:hypothetical protein
MAMPTDPEFGSDAWCDALWGRDKYSFSGVEQAAEFYRRVIRAAIEATREHYELHVHDWRPYHEYNFPNDTRTDASIKAPKVWCPTCDIVKVQPHAD